MVVDLGRMILNAAVIIPKTLFYLTTLLQLRRFHSVK
jgi:hypothetical protein